MKSRLKSLGLLATIIVVPALHAQDYVYERLEHANIFVPQLSDVQKATTTAQARLLLENVFVHQQAKLDFHKIDVAAISADFAQSSASLNGRAYLDALGTTFLSNRDLHTNYTAPAKMLCSRTLLPFTLERITGDKLIISALRLDDPITAISPEVRTLKLGDELVRYNGKEVADAVKEKMILSAGANDDARFNGGVRYLTWNPSSKPIPDGNSVELVFRKADGTELPPMNLSWITRTDRTCLASGRRAPVDLQKTVNPRKPFLEGLEVEQLEIKEAFANATQPKADLTPTPEPEINYSIIEKDGKKYGFLRLNSFAPVKKSDDESVDIVEDILVNKFRDTDGLIIDLRSNPGGNIVFADKLAQLFLPTDKELIQFRLRANDTLKFYLEHQRPELSSSTGLMLEKVNQAIVDKQSYTSTFSIALENAVHSWGTAYYKPVILLTNASCYSSCDMFSATLQDTGRVEIIGADESTGGGGANVVTTEALYGSLKDGAENKGPFHLLDLGQEMRVAFRETVRGGFHAGELLENFGARSMQVLRSTRRDVLEKDADRMEKILDHLASTPKSGDFLYFTSHEKTLNLANLQSTLGVDAAGIEKLELYQNSVLIKTFDIAGKAHFDISLPDTHFEDKVPAGLFTIKAFQQQNITPVQVAQLKRTYRLLPTLQNLPLNVADGSLIKIYNFSNTEDAGWKLVAPSTFKVGTSDRSYGSGLNSEIGLQITPTANANVKFTASVDSEKDFDFFQVVALVDGEYHQVVGPMSGKIAEQTFEANLGEWANKKVVLLFRFTSDDNTEMTGVVLKNIEVN
jgi:hypothetical protein